MGKKMRKPRGFEELQTVSNRLFYEWQMITCLTYTFETGSMGDQMLKNTFIESFVIHARIIKKFLFTRKLKLQLRPDDAIAEDFFTKSDEWTKKCPSLPEPNPLDNESFSFFANKQIAHISYTNEGQEHSTKQGHKDWNFPEITDALQPAFEKFIGLVEKEKLGDRWWKLLNDQNIPRWEELKRQLASK